MQKLVPRGESEVVLLREAVPRRVEEVILAAAVANVAINIPHCQSSSYTRV